jgi:hypothetical protein
MQKIKKKLFSTTPNVVKKHIATMLCVVLSGLFLIAGCKKNDPTGENPEYPIEILFTEYSLTKSCQWTKLTYNNTVVIINSDEELKQYVACTDNNYPKIDFSKHTLLVANGKTDHRIFEITITGLQQLSENEYELNIEIALDMAAIVKEWKVAFIVEKVSEESKVNVITTAIVKSRFPLQGTAWQLVGFVDVETGEIKEIDPKEEDRCLYCTLEFNTDNTFLAFSTANEIWGNYEVDYTTNNFRFVRVWSTLIYEPGDGDRYCEALRIIRSFSTQKNELRLYYNDKKNYLLFRSIESIFANTNWKLTGFMNIETGEIQPPEPPGKDLFLITFCGYHGVGGFASNNQLSGRYFFNERTSRILMRISKTTFFEESSDGRRYMAYLNDGIQSFSLQEDELKLFYNNKKNCLLFKKI